MAKEITITAKQVEQLISEHDNMSEKWHKASRDGRKETADRYLDMVLGMEMMLDVLGIEYED